MVQEDIEKMIHKCECGKLVVIEVDKDGYGANECECGRVFLHTPPLHEMCGIPERKYE